MTDAILNELDRYQTLTRFPEDDEAVAKAKSLPMSRTIDNLLRDLYELKHAAESGAISASGYHDLVTMVDAHKKELDERQKESYSSLTKLGKAIDKKFINNLPLSPQLFNTPEGVAALERTIGTHFIRTGAFDVAEVFYRESQVEPLPEAKSQFLEIHRVLSALRIGDIEPALQWAMTNIAFLRGRSSPFVFYLHRSHFMRILLSPPHGVNPKEAAIQYTKQYLKPLLDDHVHDISRLITSMLFLPEERMSRSPYADLTSPAIHTLLEPMFVKEYCALMGISRQLPLKVVSDIGGNGALARIEKAKKLMRDKWSQADELPIEIPIPPQNRYHSIFACPVSKEQATDKNPPMMLPCGHVVAKESLSRLTKGGGRVKCPYCPLESVGVSLQVYF